MMSLDQDINDYAAGIFLRYFRSGVLAGTVKPSLDLARDFNFLRAHWAISSPVRDFLSYVLSHRQEAQSLLQVHRRTDDAVARGRINARSTILARRVTGHPSLVLSEEPVRTFNTGPNQLVAWVVHMAASHALRLFKMQPPTSAYAGLIETAMSEIAAVKRLDVLREPLKHVAANRAVSADDLSSCDHRLQHTDGSRSRRRAGAATRAAQYSDRAT